MDKFNFEQVKEKLLRSQREVTTKLMNDAQNHFVKAFSDQGFDGKAWKEVDRRKPDTSSYKYPKSKGLQRRTSPILIGAGWKIRGGNLRRKVSVMARTTTYNGFNARMVLDVPYAGYLNDGTPNMPKRQFIGQTKELTNIQEKSIERIINKIWQA